MSADNGQTPTEAGFELEGRFYRWSISDTGKDLMLIDRFTGLPVNVFFELLEDDQERARAPVVLAMLACSIRAGNPTWSVERIVRLVMDTPVSEFVMIEGDTEEEEPGPPSEGGQEEEPPTSNGSVDESSSSATPEENSPSEKSYVTHH